MGRPARATRPAHSPQNMNRRHQELLAWMILHPEKTQKEIAAELGYTQQWLSLVVNSDMFQAQLREMREAIHGVAFANAREKLAAGTNMALDRMLELLEDPESGTNPAFVLNAADKLLKYHMPPAPSGGSGGTDVRVNVLVASPEEVAAARSALRRTKELTAPIETEQDEERVINIGGD